jgi:hypothetical protein
MQRLNPGGKAKPQDKPKAQPDPREIREGKVAHFRFDANAKDKSTGAAEFELKNTEFKDTALYLNGINEFQGNGYRAICKTPKLNYQSFTLALKLKAEDFGPGKSNLITGGVAYRWFGLHRSTAGNLTVTLNNQQLAYEIEEAPLVTGKWAVIACGVDLPSRKILVYFDGKKVAEKELPRGFQLEVANSSLKDGDKVWSFANYANAQAFHGLVEELIIYERLLPAGEFGKIPLHP